MTSTNVGVVLAKIEKKRISNMCAPKQTLYKPFSADIVNGNVWITAIGVHQIACYQDTSST